MGSQHHILLTVAVTLGGKSPWVWQCECYCQAQEGVLEKATSAVKCKKEDRDGKMMMKGWKGIKGRRNRACKDDQGLCISGKST